MAKKGKADSGLKSAAPEPVEPEQVEQKDESKVESKDESKVETKPAETKDDGDVDPKDVTSKAEEAEAPPPVPRRPPSPFSKSLAELAEAFPDANKDTSRAILVAAAGNLESAFNGMLALTDDSIRPPPPEPVPAVQSKQQIKSDEQLARELASQYARRSSRHSRPQRSQRETETPHRRSGDYNPRQENLSHPSYVEYDDQPSANDEFGEFRDNFQRGLSETRERVSSFWGQLKERFNNEIYDGDEFEEPRRTPQRPQGGFPPRRETRPDALYDEDAPLRPQRPSQEAVRPESPAKPPSTPSATGSVAAGPVNAFGEVKPARMSTLEGSAKKKWEPLAKDEPEPDAFFIGESDDDDLGSLDDGDKTKPESKDEVPTSPSKSARELLTKFKGDASETTAEDAEKVKDTEPETK